MKIEDISSAHGYSKLRAALKGRRDVIATSKFEAFRFCERWFTTEKPSDDNQTRIDQPVQDAIRALLVSAIDAEITRVDARLKALGVEIDP